MKANISPSTKDKKSVCVCVPNVRNEKRACMTSASINVTQDERLMGQTLRETDSPPFILDDTCRSQPTRKMMFSKATKKKTTTVDTDKGRIESNSVELSERTRRTLTAHIPCLLLALVCLTRHCVDYSHLFSLLTQS